jgi:predicted dehydrogenase
VSAAAVVVPGRPRLGFVGTGWIGRHRLQAVHASGLAEVAAVTDAARGAAEEAAQGSGARVAASLDELLRMDLDGLVIATPSALHAEQCLAALDHGLSVFCQKPLARTAGETRLVVDAARRARRLLGVDFCYRRTRAMEAVRQVLDSGELGAVFAVDLTFHNAYGPDKPWFYDARLSGGGCVIDLGIHLVDLALWALGDPVVENVSSRLFAGGVPLPAQPREVEDFAQARLDLAGGAVVRLACSWKLAAGRDCVIEAAFYGTRGAAVLRNVDGSFYDLVAERMRGTSREMVAQGPDDWGGRTLVGWARRLGAGEGFAEESLRLVDVADVIDRIYGR